MCRLTSAVLPPQNSAPLTGVLTRHHQSSNHLLCNLYSERCALLVYILLFGFALLRIVSEFEATVFISGTSSPK